MKSCKKMFLLMCCVLPLYFAGCKPVVTIIEPVNGDKFKVGETIIFEGKATDQEHPNLADNAFVWTSDKDGEIGTGPSIESSGLSEGRHTITLTVTDPAGQSGQSGVTITIGNGNVPTTTTTICNIVPPAGPVTPSPGQILPTETYVLCPSYNSECLGADCCDDSCQFNQILPCKQYVGTTCTLGCEDSAGYHSAIFGDDETAWITYPGEWELKIIKTTTNMVCDCTDPGLCPNPSACWCNQYCAEGAVCGDEEISIKFTIKDCGGF